ncbi:MAG: uncharacterized membrane protein YheB (UPF0754 family) [Bacteroidia bacterium]|jgi:uncharacterized membrane protein YheB (UPF0754 family)
MIYTLPFIAALVGWFTNYLAVKMLFHPKEPINFYFFKIQGIFPKNQREVAGRIGSIVADELLSSDDIRDRLNNQENILTIQEMAEAKVDYYLNVTFPSQYPIASAIMGSKRKDKFKGEIMTEMEGVVPDMVDKYMEHLEDKFDVRAIIESRVAQLPTEKLEEMISKLLRKEFKFIEYIGAVIGFIIGWIQVLMVSL